MDNIKQVAKIILLGTLLLAVGFLSSCSHVVARKDGPPNFNVDVSKIPDAVPKPEAKAKYGNMSSYTVFGKRYYTLNSSKNYEAIGTASWYGSKFHAQRTSSGERYNMLSMTAAHKTLPLPTYVEVTNLKNHRTVVVKVNDRGPFASTRIIDLSYVAAKKLGIVGHGTSMVKIKAIDPTTYGKPIEFAQRTRTTTRIYPSYARAAKTSSSLYLQVGAFRDKARAEKLQHQLASLLSTPIMISHPSSNTMLYRVKVGPIKDASTASQISGRLKILGIASSKAYGA